MRISMDSIDAKEYKQNSDNNLPFANAGYTQFT